MRERESEGEGKRTHSQSVLLPFARHGESLAIGRELDNADGRDQLLKDPNRLWILLRSTAAENITTATTTEAPSAIVYIYDPALTADGDPLVPTVLEDRGGVPALVLPARDHFFREHVEFPYPARFIPYREAMAVAPPGHVCDSAFDLCGADPLVGGCVEDVDESATGGEGHEFPVRGDAEGLH